MRTANLVLAFLLEIGLLAALFYWGFQTNEGITRWLLGLGAPLLAGAIWGLWMAPRSKNRLSDPLRLAVELLLFGLGAVGLWSANQPNLAIMFAVLVVINLLLQGLWKQR
jgi:hypothetical protein